MTGASTDHSARKKRILSLAAGILIATVGLTSMGGGIAAATGGGLAPPAVDPVTIHAPTATPDRIVLTPTETPSTSQHVTWRTASSVGSGVVQVAESSISLPQVSQTVEATISEVFPSNLGYDVKHHTATIEGLTPDTTYLYRVGDGTTWSEWFEFRTAADTSEPFSFIVHGDGQNDNKAYTSRIYRAAFEARPYAKLVVHAGDLIDTDNADNEWGEWHEASGFANQYLNTIATPGNHEYYPGPGLTNYWRAGFEFPANGPEGGDKFDEVTYFVDYQGVRFISLDSNLAFNEQDRTAQTEWLERVLQDNPNEWTVVTFHHPVFAVTSGRNNQVIRDAWLPLFEEYEVDLVVQGHDHAYGRGNLFANEEGFENGEHDGTVYLVSVAGPKMYVADPEDNNNWINNGANRRVVYEDLQLFQTVDVADGQMHVQSRTVNGEVKDSFTITKNDEGGKIVRDEEAWTAGPGSARGGVQTPDPVDPTDPGDEEPGDGEPGDGEPGDEEPGDQEPGDVTPGAAVSDSEVVAGGTLGVTGVGFDANETVVIELHSSPVELARVQANASGEVSTRVVIPAETTPGAHSVVLTGQTSGTVVSVPVEVLAAPTTPPASSGNGGLSVTGTEMGGLIGVGAILLALGGFLTIRTLRKPREVTE